jgi:PAS domain S-box-containing protein
LAVTVCLREVGAIHYPLIRSASPDQMDGWFEGQNQKGELSYAALSRSPANGWSVALAVPAVQLDAPMQRLFWSLGGAAVIFLVAGILLAVIVETRISESLKALAFKAEALGQGESVSAEGPFPVREVESLSRDISRAAGLLEQRAQERDRAELALRELNDRLEARILERTEQLEDTNDELRKEIGERHQAESALRSEHVYLNLLRSTELVIQEAHSMEAALQAALKQICLHLQAPVGYCYYGLAGAAKSDEGTVSWYERAEQQGLAALQSAVASGAAAGPAALALSSRKLCCFNDLARQDEPWARAAAAAGLVSACALSVIADDEPAGALAFFSQRAIDLDQRLSTVLTQLAMNLGRFVERQRADEALRLSEERFRTAFDEGPIGIGMVDLAMRYLRVNQALCAMLDCRNDELLGEKFFGRVHPEDLGVIEDHAERLLQGEISSYRQETRLLEKSGAVLWCCVTATLIASRNGTPNYILLLIENITESKRLEERLRETERLAAVGATSAMFAHEVGNPLNGISTTVQMIERDLARSRNGVTPVVFSALDDIKSEITRLGALLHEFRYLARPQRLQLRKVRLDNLIGDALAAETYREKGIQLQVEIPADLPELWVDEAKFKQAVANLAENAADAMPNGGTLTVQAYRVRDEICVDFSDTGIGISPGVNIFELFTTTKAHGTGLGLAVVRQIVSAHNGRIDYHSEPGNGTTFTLTLPIHGAENKTNPLGEAKI